VNIRRRLNRGRIWLTIFLAMQCTNLWSASEPTPHREILVSTEWLASHLNDPKVIVLQAGDERGNYEKEHIPGARFLDDDEYTTGHQGLMVELPAVDKLKQTLEDLGVSDDTRVVIYTTEWYPTAGRAFFTLDYLGHGNTALLNGSLAKWKAEHRALTAELPKIAKGRITPHVNESARALLEDVKAATQPTSKTLLLDSRPKKRYTAGHLAGADHIFWEETVSDPKNPVFLPPDELRRLFLARGVAPDHKVITYCEIGLQASHMYFVAKYLGYDVAMFDGSYFQWNQIEHLPVRKGESPQ
jgi:thiosulfate/3-mercaptopyruvate sulfurtransferase